jgi:hypothetical protein
MPRLLLLLVVLLAVPAAASAQAPSNPDGVAVIVGNDYAGTQLPPVEFAHNDAEAIDACFSGATATPGRTLIPAGSPVFRERPADAPQGLAVLTAAGPGQAASWDLQARQGLFTRRFLDAVSGRVEPRDGAMTLPFWQIHGFERYGDQSEWGTISVRRVLQRELEVPPGLPRAAVTIGFYPEAATYREDVSQWRSTKLQVEPARTGWCCLSVG